MSEQEIQNNDPAAEVWADPEDRAWKEMQKLYENLSFKERIKKTIAGLSMPKDSGEYKYARLQMQRMTGPVVAILVPVLIVAIMLSIPKKEGSASKNVAVEIVETTDTPELEQDEPEEPPEPDIIEPLDTDIDGPTGETTEMTPIETNEPVSPKPREISTVQMNKSPITMRNIIGSRDPGHRGALMSKYGGTGGDASVMRALRWLKKNQNADGSWGTNGSQYSAMTGLALLTYLAHGEIPGPEHPEFGETVRKAAQYLLDDQTPNGYFKHRDGNNYTHSIATYALAEFYSMTRHPLAKTACERAAVPIIKGQNEMNSWDYKYAITERSDTSFAGWTAQAVKALHTAEIDVPGLEECYQKAQKAFLCTYRGEEGGFYYAVTAASSPGGHPGLSGVGALCMQLLGAWDDRHVTQTLSYLDGCTFSFEKWDDGKSQPWGRGDGIGDNVSPIYYWYYITQAKFQAGGETFKSWNRQFMPVLTNMQQRVAAEESGYVDFENKPREIGYWDSPSKGESYHDTGNGNLPCYHWEKGKRIDGTTTMNRRVMDTCLCALQLMVYYRFLPATLSVTEQAAPKATTQKESDVRIGITKKRAAR
ncbi:MAG: terpene cyclase/mutase family protein [Kiritimatiellae bacterium]|nr:terpene cyclase/mutase family protein [Kiritimatiellia bacterium]